MTDPKETIRNLVLLLDAALPLMEREASAEAMRETGKPLRQVTAQKRAIAAHKLVDQVAKEWGIDL